MAVPTIAVSACGTRIKHAAGGGCVTPLSADARHRAYDFTLKDTFVVWHPHKVRIDENVHYKTRKQTTIIVRREIKADQVLGQSQENYQLLSLFQWLILVLYTRPSWGIFFSFI